MEEQFDAEKFYNSIGVRIPLIEFKPKIKDREFFEIKDVKTFEYYNEKIDNVSTLLVLKQENGGMWHPKNSNGTSGTSGSSRKNSRKWLGGIPIGNYNLTEKEILNVLKKFPAFGTDVKLQKYRWYVSCTDNSYRSDRRLNGFKKEKEFEYRLKYRIDSKVYLMPYFDALREFANKKLSDAKKTVTHTFTINGMPFQYVANVKETTSEYREDLCYLFYLYDVNGDFIQAFNIGGIWG